MCVLVFIENKDPVLWLGKLTVVMAFFAAGDQTNEFLQFKALAIVLEFWPYYNKLVWITVTCQTPGTNNSVLWEFHTLSL